MLVLYRPVGSRTQWVLFGYLLTVLILLRLSMAMFDVPARTLVAELTSDYDERTRLASLPISASWFHGFGDDDCDVRDLAQGFRRTYSRGRTNLGGYQQAAVVWGATILVTLLFPPSGFTRRFPIFT